MDETSACESLIRAGRDFWQRDWVPAGAGNFSARLPDGDLLLTRSGAHKGHLTRADFLRLDPQGTPRQAGVRPSAETLLHVERYRLFDQVGCVLHVHSVAATLVSRGAGRSVDLAGYELAKAFAGVETHEVVLHVPVFDNDQDIARLAEAVTAYHQRRPIDHAYLIRGHGAYVWGESVEDAVRRVEALEFLLRCHWQEMRDSSLIEGL